ncbi:MAG TPA: PorV/PorQ family protein [Ignavibacteriaceae bacterium]|jgi:opacity protein-like surface antigen|nr:PorV/PorQ family protein [Ignavibacteriaceae bacterium]
MKKFIIILFIAAGVIMGQTKTGSTAAPFLNIGIGPRAVSMGGAFVATANDITSLYWNPAGASRVGNNSAMFSYAEWFAGISYNWAGAMLSLDGAGTVGLSVTYLDYGTLEVTTLREPDGTGETFNPSDMAIALSYAYNLTEQFSIGGSVKYVNEKIWNSSANAIAADLGVLFLSDIYGLRVGASIANFGTDMKMDGKDLYVQHDINGQIFGNNDQILAKLETDAFPLPLVFRVGIAIDPVSTEDHKFTIGVDATHPNDNAESINIGGEYTFMNLISLRGGYKNLLLDNSEEGLTLGFGLKYSFVQSLGVFVDYAYQDFGKLKYTQQFSLGVNF